MMQGLEHCREEITCTSAEADERRKEHTTRDQRAAELWGGRHDDEALEEQRRKVAEFVRAVQAAHFLDIELTRSMSLFQYDCVWI